MSENISNDRIILIDRDHSADVAVVYPTAADASDAIDGSDLIDDLTAEDCLECWIPANGLNVDLIQREVIYP